MSHQSLGRLSKQEEGKGWCSRTWASQPVLLQPAQRGREVWERLLGVACCSILDVLL